ncbi:MAG: hypothetical protein Q9220_003829 [cf. Caloplaca sp. 1 TL-2023]
MFQTYHICLQLSTHPFRFPTYLKSSLPKKPRLQPPTNTASTLNPTSTDPRPMDPLETILSAHLTHLSGLAHTLPRTPRYLLQQALTRCITFRAPSSAYARLFADRAARIYAMMQRYLEDVGAET